jgi:AcrR family transcriptional regulator
LPYVDSAKILIDHHLGIVKINMDSVKIVITKRKRSYHHGDLRQALITAGLALLERDGLEGLTLRRTAAAAGVSHTAPAHHFPTLKALLTALAAIGFERFGAAMRAARERARSDPKSQMRAAGQGYVNFAIENPGLFRLMFSSTALGWDDAALAEAAQASFRQLEDIVRPIAGNVARMPPQELIKLAWCSVHGYAHLHLEGQMRWLEGENANKHPRPPDIARLLFLEKQGRGRSEKS